MLRSFIHNLQPSSPQSIANTGLNGRKLCFMFVSCQSRMHFSFYSLFRSPTFFFTSDFFSSSFSPLDSSTFAATHSFFSPSSAISLFIFFLSSFQALTEPLGKLVPDFPHFLRPKLIAHFLLIFHIPKVIVRSNVARANSVCVWTSPTVTTIHLCSICFRHGSRSLPNWSKERSPKKNMTNGVTNIQNLTPLNIGQKFPQKHLATFL